MDPIDVFYRPRTRGLRTARGRDTILLESPQELLRLIEQDYAEAEAEAAVEESAAADSDDGSGSGSAGLAVDVRENLDALALFDPEAATDAAGRITIEFDLPDNLTRYRVMAVAVSGDHADAQIVALSVYTPATSEAFATYGVVDEGAVVQSIAALRDVIPQFGGLEINTSSTALQALTDAVLYLFDYRYASSDAYASRILAISALRDVLGAFEAEGLASPDELDAAVRRDIAELSALQNSDGGFGWWSRNRPSSPYQSIQAMHALTVAQNEGFTVSDGVMASGRWYLQSIEDRIPAYYSQRSTDMLLAYALHVRSLGGDRNPYAALALWERRGTDLESDALAWIWPVVDDDGVWHVLAGAQVRVNVTMVNDSRRTNMALVDPMPAGFESLNPALAVTGEVDARRGGAADSWWWWTWYEHQNLRDDRAEAFSSYLRAGTHEYSYVVRATTPGTFVVPPAKAEEIYAPEVFGRSRTDTVIVQDQR